MIERGCDSRGVENGVVVLKELLADDEVDARRATVADPRVIRASRQTPVGVLGSGNQVLSGAQGELGAADGEGESPGGLAGENREAGRGVGGASGVREELVVGGGGYVDEGCAGVDNAASGADGGTAIGDSGDGYSPVGSNLKGINKRRRPGTEESRG